MKWKHRWVTPKARPTDSKLHGRGVFAKKKIIKGEHVVVFGGVVVPIEEHDDYLKEFGHIGIQINDRFFVCPSSKDEYRQGIFNHSCEPNCGFIDSVTLVAMRDIEPGEELCFDYAFCEAHFKGFKCNCGTASCRRVIMPDDWKRPDIQKRYRGYFSPFLKSKME